MNNCPTRDELILRLAQDDGGSTSRDVDVHLENCARCQSVLESLTGMDDLRDGELVEGDGGSRDPAIEATLTRLKKAQGRFALGSSPGMTWPPAPDQGKVASSPLRSGDQIDAYLLQEQIGAGSTGWLFRAIDSRLDREVAVKILRDPLAQSDAGRERFMREARAAAAMQHERIVRVFDVGVSVSGSPYLVLELVHGTTLASQLQSEGPVESRAAATTVAYIADALGAAHQAGLVHRDVKPSNVLLDAKSGKPKVTDFGLVLTSDVDSQLTFEGQITGTPAYMSPEQVLNPHDVDARSDVYSLGVLLYEVLTGELPFRGAVRMTLAQVLHEEPTDIRKLDDRITKDLATICQKAMSKEPLRRYQTAYAMRDDLNRFLQGEPIVARPISQIERAWKTAKRYPAATALAIGVAGLLVTIAVGSLWFTASLRETQRQAELEAATANHQRALTLRTLRDLVTKVNAEIEGDFVDYDRIQQQLLVTAEHGLQTLTQSSTQQESIAIAEAQHLLGVVRSYLGEPEEALAVQDFAIRKCEEIGRHPQYASQALLIQAKCFAAKAIDDFEGEEELLNQCIEVLTQLDELEPATFNQSDAFELQGDVYGRLALIYQYQAEYPDDPQADQELRYLKQSAEAYQQRLQLAAPTSLLLENSVYSNIDYSAALDQRLSTDEAIRTAQIALAQSRQLVDLAVEDDWSANNTLQDALIQLARVSPLPQHIDSLKEARQIGMEMMEIVPGSEALATQLGLEVSLAHAEWEQAEGSHRWYQIAWETFSALRQMEVLENDRVGSAMLQFSLAAKAHPQPTKQHLTVASAATTEQLELAWKQDPSDPDVAIDLMAVYQLREEGADGSQNWQQKQHHLLTRIRDRELDVGDEWLDQQSERLRPTEQ